MSLVTAMLELTDSELDLVAGGQATASIEIKNLSASGPASATASATDVTATAATVGGLTPSNTATVSGTFAATSA